MELARISDILDWTTERTTPGNYLGTSASTRDPESEQTTELINVLDEARCPTLYVVEHSLINGLSSRRPTTRKGFGRSYNKLEILPFSRALRTQAAGARRNGAVRATRLPPGRLLEGHSGELFQTLQNP